MYPVPIVLNQPDASRRVIPIWMVDADGFTPLPGQSGRPSITLPDGSQAPAANTIVEVDGTNHPGLYTLQLAVAEVLQKGVGLVSHQESTSAQFHGSFIVSDDETVLAAIVAKQAEHDGRFDDIDTHQALHDTRFDAIDLALQQLLATTSGASAGRITMQVEGGVGAEFLLIIAQGEDVAIQLRYVNGHGEALSLAGLTIHFRVKLDVSSPDLILKTSADPAEISIDNEAAGYATVYLDRAETEALSVVTHYADCWTVSSTGIQDRTAKGSLKVEDGGSFTP